MVIPNYLIINNILDPILNHSKEIEYVYMFLRKYTLISKEWNQSIIVKLQYRHVNNLERPRTVELIPDFIALANKYKWYNYRFRIPKPIKDLNEIIRDQVSQILFNKNTVQSMTLDQSISQLKNLESIVVETSFLDSEELLINQLKSFSNIDIHIQSLQQKSSKIDFNRIGELIQNRGVISLDFWDFSFLGENRNSFHPNSLTKITLVEIRMSQWMLKSLLDNSLNCQNIHIQDVILNEDKDHYDKVLEILNHASQSMNLQRVSVSTEDTTSYQTAVDFLSNIKTGTLIVILDDIEWDNEKLPDNIPNQWIHSLELYTSKGGIILELWKHKDNIKSILLSDAGKSLVKEFKNLHTLITKEVDFDSLKQLSGLQYLTLPHLPSSMGVNDLLALKNFRTIDFHELDIGVLNQLLSIPHPSVQSYNILSLQYNENSIKNDLGLFIKSLSHNTTLKGLVISDFGYKFNNSYNHCKLYIEILTINKTLHKFILPPPMSNTFKYTTGMVKEFNELFRINTSIHQIKCFDLPYEYLSSTEITSQIQIKLDLLDVFSKYNVIINSSI
ncbi:hypothetical protein DLAC_10351 [Tieghemostelium lacteum]|uniref:Uncharacterized protein n=1 Tax=Tieghemostelium lacteum TaxID=361077 RepID=A0A151Z579_TIELA|nr:hypothetical protein DLAC_10351 [Tieghemostelium lacteum]|eukprot:KYQ89116.1 hypothetical protein DLAC_10351 [Tieghemostelium lacteum]